MIAHCFLVLSILILANAESEYITIELPDGPIFGTKTTSFSSYPYYSFQKIPYAAPPVGDLRFQPPVPPTPWTDSLNATYLDAICYQISTDLPEETEDCLYINVFTPGLGIDNFALPVLLYIYGGGFYEGHAMTYRRGPEYLIDYGIVIVTFNYRLGPLGFLSTEDTVVPGNNGLKDQQLALKWVHNNINLFGGNPEKITIVGESAGGASVSYQLLNKNNEGLFRGAIMESGTAINLQGLQRNAKTVAFDFATVLNDSFRTTDDSQALLDYLMTVPAKDLDVASTQVSGWSPVIEVEHNGAFNTEKMYGLVKSGNFVKVPILMGLNSEESLNSAADLNSLEQTMEYYDSNLEVLVPVDMRITDAETQTEYGKAIREIYVEDGLFAGNLAKGVKYTSDNSFNRGIIRYAELKSQFTDVYFYQFSYDGPLGNVTISLDGADHVAHAEEIRYLWRTTRDGYDNSDLSKYPEEDVSTQHRMLTLWTNFVKFLNPTPGAIDVLENVIWPTVASGEEGDFLYLDIANNLEVKNHPKADTYSQWTQLYDTLGYDDFDTY